MRRIPFFLLLLLWSPAVSWSQANDARTAVVQDKSVAAKTKTVPAETASAWKSSAQELKAANGAAGQGSRVAASKEALRLQSVASSTSALVDRLVQSQTALTDDQQMTITQALKSAALARYSVEALGVAKPADTERLRQAERQIALAYWESPASNSETAVLAPHQAGYVLEDRFAAIQRELDRSPSLETKASFGPLITMALAQARSLSDSNDQTPSAELQRLLRSADRISKNPDKLSAPATHSALVTINQDLGQQVQFMSLNGGPLVALTVKTVTSEKQEVKGYTIYYLLAADHALKDYPEFNITPATLDGLSTTQGMLGPYSYVLWGEKAGVKTPEKDVNLGATLEPTRTIEIPVAATSAGGNGR
jgi:hypothetical protein